VAKGSCIGCERDPSEAALISSAKRAASAYDT